VAVDHEPRQEDPVPFLTAPERGLGLEADRLDAGDGLEVDCAVDAIDTGKAFTGMFGVYDSQLELVFLIGGFSHALADGEPVAVVHGSLAVITIPIHCSMSSRCPSLVWTYTRSMIRPAPK